VETIDKLSWVYIQNRKVLFVRSRGKDLFYHPGGKREKGETDEQTLIREVNEELSVDLIPETIQYLETFTAQADGKPNGVMVKVTYYAADFRGRLQPSAEIEEMAWFTSQDMNKTSATGKLFLAWLKERILII
jgi:8-oxo-dGTP pyrophosphatase MutT (NUDIX family)